MASVKIPGRALILTSSIDDTLIIAGVSILINVCKYKTYLTSKLIFNGRNISQKQILSYRYYYNMDCTKVINTKLDYSKQVNDLVNA